jgi:hypothetical protein
VAGSAVERLEWVLNGLNGNDGWGTDVDAVLAPQFAALMPRGLFAERIR